MPPKAPITPLPGPPPGPPPVALPISRGDEEVYLVKASVPDPDADGRSLKPDTKVIGRIIRGHLNQAKEDGFFEPNSPPPPTALPGFFDAPADIDDPNPDDTMEQRNARKRERRPRADSPPPPPKRGRRGGKNKRDRLPPPPRGGRPRDDRRREDPAPKPRPSQRRL